METDGVGGRWRGVRESLSELLDREFDPSPGHLTAVGSCCVFAPSLLTFWFFNGLVDFSTAAAVGSLGGGPGLFVRLVAYVLVVPVFIALRVGYYLAHPTHRRAVLSGVCPTATVLSLDWFTVGILATGLPFALQDVGPWAGMNAVFLAGVFVFPRLVRSERRAITVRLGALAVGTAVFLYARYGTVLAPPLPTPGAVLGPVATARLDEATTATLVAIINSLTLGPVIVAGFALAMNRLLTRPELRSLPVVRHSLPRRDPTRIVATSAAVGTVFYLLVAWSLTGQLVVVP